MGAMLLNAVLGSHDGCGEEEALAVNISCPITISSGKN
jgi:hypothetical protein